MLVTPEEIQNLLQSKNIHFDVIAITETWILKNVSVTQNTELTNYSFEHTPTESSAPELTNYSFEHTPTESSALGTLLYLAN